MMKRTDCAYVSLIVLQIEVALVVVGMGCWMLRSQHVNEFREQVGPDPNSEVVVPLRDLSEVPPVMVLPYVLISCGSLIAVLFVVDLVVVWSRPGSDVHMLTSCGVLWMTTLLLCGSLVQAAIAHFSTDGVEVNEEKVKGDGSQLLTRVLKTYNTSEKSKMFIQTMQHQYDCCGVAEGVKDYNHTSNSPNICVKEFKTKPCLPHVYEELSARIRQFHREKLKSSPLAETFYVTVAMMGLQMLIVLLTACTVLHRATPEDRDAAAATAERDSEEDPGQ